MNEEYDSSEKNDAFSNEPMQSGEREEGISLLDEKHEREKISRLIAFQEGG